MSARRLVSALASCRIHDRGVRRLGWVPGQCEEDGPGRQEQTDNEADQRPNVLG